MVRDDRDIDEAKWVRIMCDYCSDPVWAPDGSGTTLDALPVSASLRDDLERWSEWYDRHDVFEGPKLDVRAFSAEGRELARRVKAELPDWTKDYMQRVESALGDAYTEPAGDVRGYIAQVTGQAVAG